MSGMCPVIHFEMPYDDRDRMAAFYRSVFNWRTEMLGSDMGHYVLASTTESDAEGCVPREPGRINGGFYGRNPQWPAQHPSVVIGVEDIRAAMRRVAAAGGEVRQHAPACAPARPAGVNGANPSSTTHHWSHAWPGQSSSTWPSPT